MIAAIINWFLTRGDFPTAWSRCLPIWHRDGGIDDLRGIAGQPFYTPSRGRRLARAFAKRHSKHVELVMKQTQNADPITAICAVDLLIEISRAAPELIPHVAASSLPLKESIRSTLESDASIVSKSDAEIPPRFETVGSYFRWQYELSLGAK